MAELHELLDVQEKSTFEFNSANFKDPKLPLGLKVIDVALILPGDTEASLARFGARMFDSADEITVKNGNFGIVKWPVSGWRQLDPETGDEAGTTEGSFDVHWEGDYYFGKNLGIATKNNTYLDGLAAIPEHAVHVQLKLPSTPVAESEIEVAASDPSQSISPVYSREQEEQHIFLWMSDYHPDGGQLFWCEQHIPFVVCLGPASCGDDVTPHDMQAFQIPAGKGVYFPAGTWHNGVYVHPSYGAVRFLTRQGRVHARVSCSWAMEFQTLLRVPLVR